MNDHDDSLPNTICVKCWCQTNNFHEFYCTVETTYKKYLVKKNLQEDVLKIYVPQFVKVDECDSELLNNVTAKTEINKNDRNCLHGSTSPLKQEDSSNDIFPEFLNHEGKI